MSLKKTFVVLCYIEVYMEILPIMRAKKQPICYIVAGSNGAGKTTFALQYLPKIVSAKYLVRKRRAQKKAEAAIS